MLSSHVYAMFTTLLFKAMEDGKCIGAIVCKLDLHKKVVRRGYIAMLAVDKEYRRKGIGKHVLGLHFTSKCAFNFG